MWWTNVIGYAYSLFIGHIFIKLNVDALWAGQGVGKKQRYLWHPALVGILERTLYTASFQVGQAGFIAVWLALKAVPQWKRWSEITTFGDQRIEGRAVYNIFLTGNAFSVLYAVTGAKLIEWLASGQTYLAFSVGSALVVGTVFSYLLSKRIRHVG